MFNTRRALHWPIIMGQTRLPQRHCESLDGWFGGESTIWVHEHLAFYAGLMYSMQFREASHIYIIANLNPGLRRGLLYSVIIPCSPTS